MAFKTYLPQDYNTFVGIDVDKNSYAFTVEDRNGLRISKKIPADPQQLEQYIQKRYGQDGVIIAYEAGPTGFGLYDYLTKQGRSCVVVSPSSIPKASNERVKNNRIDSLRITDHLKSGRLKPVRVPAGEYRELRYLIHIRELQTKRRKASKQRIKALLLLAGLHEQLRDVEQNWSGKYLRHLKELRCSPSQRMGLDMHLTDLEHSRRQTQVVLTALRKIVRDHEGLNNNVQYLTSIPGVGFITAVTVLGRIGDPQNLQNVREISAFLGLVPREQSTGDEVNRGSITHLGNRTLRGILIECAWTSIRKDKELGQFYYRIKNRHHPKIGARKAIVAVARKLTQRMYRVLKDQRMYQTR